MEPTGALRCSHPGRVLLQGDDARGASLSRPMAACGLDVPGKRTPRGVAHLRYARVVCALTSASGCAPGRDEHQLVRGAAGGPAHRASRCATLFAPGAGAPCMLRRDQLIRLLTSYRGGRMLLEAAWTDLVCRVAPRLITNLEEYPEAGLARLRMTRSRRHQVRGRGTGNYCDRKSAEGELI